MFNRIKPLFINGRRITDSLAIELAEYMNEDRALFVAQLRVERGYTWSLIGEECARVWGKDLCRRPGAGAALCELAAAYLGEDWDYLDSM